MKEKLFCILSISAVAILVVGCPFQGPIYEEHLANGYVVCALDVMEDASIILKDSERASGGTQVVPSGVFAYGWNEDFILAKQHPRKDNKVDKSVTYWFIVEVASGSVHGPLSEEQFNELRSELKVPAELSFKTIQ